MNKNEALGILFSCAELYKQNLANKNVLFICVDKNNKIHMMETVFLPTAFLHLTGVKFEQGRELSAREFFKKCLNKRLSVDEFEMSRDGTTEQKLRVLPMLFRKNLSATMMGDFCEKRLVLVTEKLVGGVNGCLGFVCSSNSRFYVPNTSLNIDIRNSISNQKRIISIYTKPKAETLYSECVYKAKNIDFTEITLPEEYQYLIGLHKI